MNRFAWKAGEAVDEAVRNLTSDTRRLVGQLVIAALVIGLALHSDASATTHLRQNAEAFEDDGGNIASVVSPDGIDPTACLSLGRIDGVLAVATVDRGGETINELTSGVDIPVAFVSEGFADLAGADRRWLQPGSFLVDAEYASERDWAAGREMVVTDSRGTRTLKVSSIAQLSRVDSIFTAGIVVSATPISPTMSCYIEVETWLRPIAPSLLAATALPGDEPPTTRFKADPAPNLNRDLGERATRWLPLASGTFIGLVLALAHLARRGDYGLYRAVGCSRATIALMGIVEQIAVILLAAATATAIVCAVLKTEFSVVGVGALGAAASAVVVAAIASIGLAPRNAVFELVRDR